MTTTCKEFSDQTLRDFLRQEIGQVTRLPAEDIEDNASIQEYGLNSLEVVVLCGRLEDTFDIEVDPSIVFECHSIEAVCKRLLENGEAR